MTSSGHGCYLKTPVTMPSPGGGPSLTVRLRLRSRHGAGQCSASTPPLKVEAEAQRSAAQQSRTGNESCAAVVRCGAARRRGAPCISQALPGLDALCALCCSAWAHSHHGAEPGRFDFPGYPPPRWVPTTWWLLGRGPLAALTDCQPPLAGGAQELRLLSSLVFVPLVSRRSRTWLRSSSVHILPVPICESFPRPRSSPRAEKLSPQRCLARSQHQGLSSRPVVVTRPSFPCPALRAKASNARPPLHLVPRTSASRFSSSREKLTSRTPFNAPPSLLSSPSPAGRPPQLPCACILVVLPLLFYSHPRLACPVRLRSVAHRRSLNGAT